MNNETGVDYFVFAVLSIKFYQIVLIMYHFWKHCPYTPVPGPCAAILPVHEALNLMRKKKKNLPEVLSKRKHLYLIISLAAGPGQDEKTENG